MPISWCNAIPAIIGVLLPWQTVWIVDKPNEFAVLQLFAWQVLLCAWWCWRGWPGAKMVAALWGALSVPALFLANPGGALWHAAALAVGAILAATVANLSVEERAWWWRGLALGFIPVALLAVWHVVAGAAPAITPLGLAERNAERLGESVVLIQNHRWLRAYGTFAHPNILAAWSVVMVALGLRTSEKWGRWLVGGAACVALITFSRSGMLALALLALWHHPRTTRWVWWGAGVSTIALWVMIFLTPNILTALRGGGTLEVRSISERQQQIVTTGGLLSDPRIALMGTGVGQSTLVQQEKNPGNPTYFYQPVHNTPLLALIELGIPLTLLCVWLLWKERAHIPTVLAVLIPFFAVDHLLWTSAVGPLILGLVSTLDERLLSGKMTQQ